MADEKVSLEGLWNKYALEEDEQRKKVWLDIFLCRAMEEWEFQPQRDALPSIIAPTLVSELKMEIGSSKCKFIILCTIINHTLNYITTVVFLLFLQSFVIPWPLKI